MTDEGLLSAFPLRLPDTEASSLDHYIPKNTGWSVVPTCWGDCSADKPRPRLTQTDSYTHTHTHTEKKESLCGNTQESWQTGGKERGERDLISIALFHHIAHSGLPCHNTSEAASSFQQRVRIKETFLMRCSSLSRHAHAATNRERPLLFSSETHTLMTRIQSCGRSLCGSA